MGESACLMRSYSQPSDVSHESKEGDPLRALTESVSFGRFMSESLAWEKWSSFSHNRHLEEVEKFSKPGSVAQKKAYFEAHYKRIAAAKKAAALLEEANAVINDVSESYISIEAQCVSSMDSESTNSNIHVVIDKSQGSRLSSVDANGCNRPVELFELGNAKIEKAESVIKDHDLVESTNEVENKDQLENVENKDKIFVTQEERTPVKEAVVQESLASTSKKKQASSSSNSSISTRKSKLPFPAKLATLVLPRKEIYATSSSKKFERDSLDKKLSISNSLHMSINRESLASKSNKKREISSSNSSTSSMQSKLPFIAKLTSPVQLKKEITVDSSSKKSSRDSVDKKRSIRAPLHMSINLGSHEASRKTHSSAQKIGNLSASSRRSKDSSTPLRTRTLASVSREVKHPSVTPKTESRRSRTLLDHSNSGSRPANGNWHSSLFLDHSKSLTASESKTRSPTVSSPFRFRSEARAAKRKQFYQKIEEKKTAAEAEKVKMQTKSKEKAKNGIKKLQQSFVFRNNSVADNNNNNHETATASNHRKIPPTHPQSPKIGGKPTTSIAQDTSYRPPRRPSVMIGGSSHSIGKNNQPLSKKTTRENASPNILVYL